MFSRNIIDLVRQQGMAQAKPLQMPPDQQVAPQGVAQPQPVQQPQQPFPWQRGMMGAQGQAQGLPPGLQMLLQGLQQGQQPNMGGAVQSLRQQPRLFGNMMPQQQQMQQNAAPWAGGFKNRLGFFGRAGQ